MDEMTSSEFRRRYATLTEPTVVTALGRPIGEWIPADYRPKIGLTTTVSLKGEAKMMGPREIIEQPSLTDRFNSQPFTGPIPKKPK